jgi:site-specific DNA-methyltransferase (adenine-specific)
MHRVMWHLEEQGFIIKDVFFWVYFNGMPKTRNIGLDIDKAQGEQSEIVGHYKYTQGYIKNGADTYKVKAEKPILRPTSKEGLKYNGAGLNVKPFYEPIILVQKRPTEATLVENIQKYEVGVLNLEDTRIPYLKGEGKVGHNPHPKGRVAGNIIRDGEFGDTNDKFFRIQPSEIDEIAEVEYQELYEKMFFEPKVRQNAENFNNHPTKKPVRLMEHLVKLLSWEGQTVLDPFMGSGSTGVACMAHKRNFIGYELEEKFFDIAKRRIEEAEKSSLERLGFEAEE